MRLLIIFFLYKNIFLWIFNLNIESIIFEKRNLTRFGNIFGYKILQ